MKSINKIVYVLSLFMLFSCSSNKSTSESDKKDTSTLNNTSLNTSISSNNTPSIGNDENIKYIGAGFNMFKGVPFYEDNSINVNSHILDTKNLNFLNSIKINDVKEKPHCDFYSDNSTTGMAQNYSQMANGNFDFPLGIINVNMETIFNRNTGFKLPQKEYYELYQEMYCKKEIYSTLATKEFHNLLSQEFKNDVLKIKSVDDAYKLYSKYGTHMLTGYTLGGLLQVSTYFATNSSSYFKKCNVGLDTQINEMKNAESNKFSEKYGLDDNNDKAKYLYKVNAYGGIKNSNLSIDSLFSKEHEFKKWEDSINDSENLKIITTPKKYPLIPIWEVLPITKEYTSAKNIMLQAFVNKGQGLYSFYCKNKDAVTNDISLTYDTYSPQLSIKGFTKTNINGVTRYVNTTESNIVVEKGSTIVLDYDSNFDEQAIEWTCNNSAATVIDSKKGIFKIKENITSLQMMSVTFFCNINQSYNRIGLTIQISDQDIKYSGGFGTKLDPYVIMNKKDLNDFYTYSDFNKYFILLDNIDMGGAYISCMSESKKFTGNFDGNHFTISNFTISDYANQKVFGMFSYNSGVIKNLNLHNVTLSASSNYAESAGALVGHNASQGEVYNCSLNQSDVTLTTQSSSVAYQGLGGLIGINEGICSYLTVQNTYVTQNYLEGKVDTYTFTGGICGRNYNSIKYSYIYSCYITNTTNSSKKAIHANAGGICGDIMDNSEIENCYAKGLTIEASGSGWAFDWNTMQHAGPICGIATKGSIIKCVANNTRSLKGETIGSFVGKEDGSTYSNCYCQTYSSTKAFGSGSNTNVTTSSSAISYNIVHNNGFDWNWINNGGLALNQKELDAGIPVVYNTIFDDYYIKNTIAPLFKSIIICYSDGTADISYIYALDGFNKYSSEGEYTHIIKTAGASRDYNINVLNCDDSLKRLDVSLASSDKFKIDDSLSVTDFKFKAVYKNGTAEIISSDLVKMEYSQLQNGLNTIKFSYLDCETLFAINVEEKYVSSIMIKNQPTHLKYNSGDEFSLDGLKLKALYNDSSEKELLSNEYYLLNKRISEGENQVYFCSRNFKVTNIKVIGGQF